MSSYILHWKFNLVKTRGEESKWLQPYSLVSGNVPGSILYLTFRLWRLYLAWKQSPRYKDGKCDIWFMTRKWHHHSRDFITFSSDILGLTSADCPRSLLHPLMTVVCCLSFSLEGGIWCWCSVTLLWVSAPKCPSDHFCLSTLVCLDELAHLKSVKQPGLDTFVKL